MLVSEVCAFGGPEVLRLAERPDPVADPGEVVVRVRAATVNPTDLSARDGSVTRRMPQVTLPIVPGWDLAGEVAALGEGVDGLAVGDRVAGMLYWPHTAGATGAYSQLVAVDAGWLVHTPDALDDATAATIPLNALTAHQGLALIDPAPGSTLLVTGASGAVGAFAAQLGVQRGLRVIAQASTGDEDFVASLAVEEVLPRSTDLAGIDEVDNVFDAVPLGADAATRMAEGGTAVFTRGVDAEAPAGHRFEVVLVRPDREALARLVDDVAEGLLLTRVEQVLPLAEAGRAHALCEERGRRGKIVLAP